MEYQSRRKCLATKHKFKKNYCGTKKKQKKNSGTQRCSKQPFVLFIFILFNTKSAQIFLQSISARIENELKSKEQSGPGNRLDIKKMNKKKT